jgi:hypothetical protein
MTEWKSRAPRAYQRRTCRRRADREQLSRRYQYQAGAARAGGLVRWDGRQGHGEPDVAQGDLDLAPRRARERPEGAARDQEHARRERRGPAHCLFANAPERLHDEITADYSDMIYATTPEEIEVRRKSFIRKWRLKHPTVADSLEEGRRPLTFARLPPSQWRSVRTTNVTERLHEEFKRRIKTKPFRRRPTPPRCSSGHYSHQDRSICAKRMVGRRSRQNPLIRRLALPPETIPSFYQRMLHTELQPHSGRTRVSRAIVQHKQMAFPQRRQKVLRSSFCRGSVH